MLKREVLNLYKKFRLMTYRGLFGAIREKDGSLSATEAYTADVIYLLESPTITRLADALNISQPNATYKVNNLVNKGYVLKTVSEDDKRECRLQVTDKFLTYYANGAAFVEQAVNELQGKFSEEELDIFEKMLWSLNHAMK